MIAIQGIHVASQPRERDGERSRADWAIATVSAALRQLPNVSRQSSITTGMPLSISATVGRITLILSIGWVPGAPFTSGRIGMPKCYTFTSEASGDIRYSMKSLAALGCFVPFTIAEGEMIRIDPSVG